MTGRIWTLIGSSTAEKMMHSGPALKPMERVDVVDEERVAFRVAQATLQLREENQRLALENAELRGSSV